MRIVFDTNVLISAYLSSGGTSEGVFEAALKRHTVILSDYIFDEFRKILTKKFHVPEAVIHPVLSGLRQDVVTLEPISLDGIQFSDKKDIPVLALIKAAKAQVLVTGDKRLLALKKFLSAVILSPREAMEIL